MKITTLQSQLTTRNRTVRLFALLLACCWLLTPTFGQNSVEVLKISAPAHSQNGTVGSWTVPAGGPYKLRITAKGAKGGTGNSSSRGNFYPGGAGAVMSADFTVFSGQVLESVAGAPGQDFQFSTGGGGGGGASGVRLSDGTVLIVAGGGGGGGTTSALDGPGKPALLSNTGTQGGAAGDGSGGGGLTTPGGNGTNSTGGGAGYNATGGSSGGSGGGGYGAGGAGNFGGGGGGGYNGGNGGGDPGTNSQFNGFGGYGGGSYHIGSNPNNSIGNNGGGQVIIEVLDVGVTATATQPTCDNPNQGSVSLNLTGDFDGNTTDFEYAIVAGNSFTGTPTFADLTADPFNLSSGFGTTGDADGETYTVRVRSKSGPALFVDNTYTLTSLPQPALSPGGIPAICAGSTSFTVPYLGTTNNPTTYSVSGTGILAVTDAPLPGSPITISLSSPALSGTIDFSLSVKNAAGCVSTPTSAEVTVNALPTASIVTNNSAICAGSDASFTVSGTDGATLTYTLTGQAGNQTLALNGGNQTITAPNATSDVTLTLVSVAKDNCQATLSETSTVTVNPLPMVDAGPDKFVYLGYGSTCTDLMATATGTPTLSYAWDMGAGNGATVNVCPEITTTYTVTVTDGKGCQATDQLTVTVQDVRCGNNNDKVLVCHNGNELCISVDGVADHLAHGDVLGRCGNSASRIGYETETTRLPLQLTLKAYPNPVQNAVTVEVLSPSAGTANFEVLDVAGRVRQSRQQELVEGLNEVEFRLGSLPTGIYLIKAIDALNRQGVVRVSKQ